MSEWRNTTHDWAGSVDLDHLARIRRNPEEFAPDGGHAVVTVHPDGSIPEAQRLPDGHPRRGVSVVAALSDWLVHTNRRRNGSWTQRYERGAPVTDLSPIADDGTTGTTVRFLPGQEIGPLRLPEAGDWPHLSVEVVR